MSSPGRRWIVGIAVLVVIGATAVALVIALDKGTSATSDRVATIAVAESLIGLGVAAYATKLTGDSAKIARATLRMQRVLNDIDRVGVLLRQVTLITTDNVTDDTGVLLGANLVELGTKPKATQGLLEAIGSGSVTQELIIAATEELRNMIDGLRVELKETS